MLCVIQIIQNLILISNHDSQNVHKTWKYLRNAQEINKCIPKTYKCNLQSLSIIFITINYKYTHMYTTTKNHIVPF